MSLPAPAMRPRPWVFFGALYGTAVLLGAADCRLPERPSAALSAFVAISFNLWWLWRDARRRGVPAGNWTSFLIISANPLGMLVWLLRTRSWRGLAAFALYVLAWAGFSLAMVLGTLVALIASGDLRW